MSAGFRQRRSRRPPRRSAFAELEKALSCCPRSSRGAHLRAGVSGALRRHVVCDLCLIGDFPAYMATLPNRCMNLAIDSIAAVREQATRLSFFRLGVTSSLRYFVSAVYRQLRAGGSHASQRVKGGGTSRRAAPSLLEVEETTQHSSPHLGGTPCLRADTGFYGALRHTACTLAVISLPDMLLSRGNKAAISS